MKKIFLAVGLLVITAQSNGTWDRPNVIDFSGYAETGQKTEEVAKKATPEQIEDALENMDNKKLSKEEWVKKMETVCGELTPGEKGKIEGIPPYLKVERVNSIVKVLKQKKEAAKKNESQN
ncbi:MAG: hypothetical protein M1549_03765 [Candidatus Dependentiae bacterium]|nr:hypothetical protein [Candidatus Dependentiae bacterium]